jgi:hypothetical protein
MTGPWLIVKWLGIAILSLYLALLIAVFWRFRGRRSRIRQGAFLPIYVGGFIGGTVPWIFGNVVFARVCFVSESLVYLFGVTVLLRGLSSEGGKSLFKDDCAENFIQPLRLS